MMPSPSPCVSNSALSTQACHSIQRLQLRPGGCASCRHCTKIATLALALTYHFAPQRELLSLDFFDNQTILEVILDHPPTGPIQRWQKHRLTYLKKLKPNLNVSQGFDQYSYDLELLKD